MCKLLNSICISKYVYLILFLILSQNILGQKFVTMRLDGLKEGKELMYILHDGKSDTMAVNLFIENAPKKFRSPKLPRFAIIGNERKYYMGISGNVVGIASYDFGGAINNSANFIPNMIPIPKNPAQMRLTQFNIQQTTLAFNFVSLSSSGRVFGAYINSNFDEDNNFNIENAYVTYAGFLAGYTPTTFSDQAAIPTTIDTQGPCGMINNTNYVISYTHKINKHWSVGVALETPFSDYTVTPELEETTYQYIPDIPIHGKYAWNDGNSWIRLAAIMRNFTYRDLIVNENRNKSGWGVNMTGSLAFGNFTVFFQGAYGKGIANYIQDMNGLGMDLYPDKYKKGFLSANNAWGAYGALQYNYNSNLFSTIIYSQDRIYDSGDYNAGSNYHFGQYIAANLIWNIKSNIQIGAEYLYGRLTDINNESNHANRINALFSFLF